MAAVFAELEGFGVLDAAAFLLAVKLDEFFAEAVGGGAGAAAERLAELAFFGRALGGVGGHGVTVSKFRADQKLSICDSSVQSASAFCSATLSIPTTRFGTNGFGFLK